MPEISRFTVACVAVCTLVAGIAAVDYAHVQSRMPSAALEQQFQSRAWIYAFVFAAAIAVATAVAMRSRRRPCWQRVFTNLGIAGVWTGVAVTILLVINDGDPVALPAAPLYAPSVLMIASAAVGTAMTRREGWGDTDAVAEARAGATAAGKSVGKWALGPLLADSRRDAAAEFFSTWAFALSAATIALAVIFIAPQPACGGGGEAPPGWTDTVGAIVGISSIAAIAAGIAALLLRRWVPALVSLVASPVALLFMAASTCAFY